MAGFISSGQRGGSSQFSGGDLKAKRESEGVSKFHLAATYGCDVRLVSCIENSEIVSAATTAKYVAALEWISKVPPTERTKAIIKSHSESLGAGLAELEKLAAYVRKKL